MKKIEEMRITVGFPGAGKTTFAKQFSDTNSQYYMRNRKFADIIDFDSVFKTLNVKVGEDLDKDKVYRKALPRLKYDILILDGLFLTQKDVEWILSVYLENPKFTERVEVKKIIVDCWVPDKEACLWNDRGRRTVNSKVSIRLLKQEEIDIKKIEERFGIKTKLEMHSVICKPEYRVFVEENGIKTSRDGNYLESAAWCLGGESWGWDGGKHEISPEKPYNFDEFDALLEKICPTITFLQYKKLYNNTVTMEERDNSDYYSRATEAYWRCDLEKLWDMLKEMGIATLD